MRLQQSELWENVDGSISGVIYGELPNKSNGRQIASRGGRWQRQGLRVRWKPRMAVVKGDKALAYEARFRAIVRRSKLGAAVPLYGATSAADLKRGIQPLHFEAHVHGGFVRDLDVELLPDLLQKNRVINNDRAIRSKRYRWTYTTSSPRVEFLVRSMREGD